MFLFSCVLRKVGSLSTMGSTALGPALAVSVGLASHIPGSEIVLCTDGEPNVGVGCLGGSLATTETSGFYSQVGA